jgi:expansin (peptidoglycan-binding protein)
MTLDKWLLIAGKVHKLVDIFDNEQEANNFALVLQDNCYTTICKMKDGKWGVYWRPRTGILCPYGVV